MKTIFIPFSKVEKKNIIEYMFDNLNVASTDNGNYGYIVSGYYYEKYNFTAQLSAKKRAAEAALYLNSSYLLLFIHHSDQSTHQKISSLHQYIFLHQPSNPA